MSLVGNEIGSRPARSTAVGVAIAIGCVAIAVTLDPRDATAGGEANDALDPYVGWYELAPGDHRLLTYSADGGLRLISLPTTPSSYSFRRVSDRIFRWERKEGPETEVRFNLTTAGSVTGFEWTDVDGSAHNATRATQRGYHVRELEYESASATISASLFVPRSEGMHAAAVMIHGSGDSDRDNLWYMWIAHTLVESGTAVLLPDKRGCGKSGGDWKTASFEDFATDTRAGVEAIRGENGIDPNRVGLIGCSQGGWIAPLAASELPRLAFMVSLSGAAVTPNEQLKHELGQNRIAVWFAKRKRPVWWEKNGDFDPIPYWAAYEGPSLIVYGREDEQDNVPVARSEDRLKRLKRDHPVDMTIKVFEGTGHGFFEPGRRRIRQDFLGFLVDWVAERTQGGVSEY